MNMIALALAVFWKETQVIFKDRGGLALMLILPLFIGLITGTPNAVLANKSGEPAIVLDVALTNADEGAFGAEVERALGEINELKIETLPVAAAAEERVAKGKAQAAILIPTGFSQKIDTHSPTTIEVVVDPGQPESASIIIGITKAVAAELTTWGEVQFGIRSVLQQSGELAGASDEQRRGIEAQILGVVMTTLSELRRTQAIAVVEETLGSGSSGDWVGPYLAMMFAGYTVLFIFIGVSWSASSLLQEREAGTLRRLVAAPIPSGAVIAGKMMAFMLLSCVQVVVMFSVARVALGVPLGQSPLGLVLLTLAVAFCATALGMMVAAVTKSANQASSMGLLLGFLMGGLGGCLPAFSTTPLVRSENTLGAVARLLPQGHAVEGYYRLMAEKTALWQILPQLGVVLLFGIVFFLIARWRFKFV